MFSGGGDSSGEGINFNQFRFQLPTSQSLSGAGGSIDWASLAQQWIQMKDQPNANFQHDVMPKAPPPPNISGHNQFVTIDEVSYKKKTNFEEKGEADMDMDEEDYMLNQDQSRHYSPPPKAPSMAIIEPISSIVQQQWYMPQLTGQPVQIPTLDMGNNFNQQQISNQWNTWQQQIMPVPQTIVANSSSSSTSHIPQLMKINVPHPSTTKSLTPNNSNESNSNAVTMDAAKRKILPAWIREGLEKMEREKQKQMEKEQSVQSNEVDTKILDDSDKQELLTSSHLTVKNKTILENDSSGNEDDDNDYGDVVVDKNVDEYGKSLRVDTPTKTPVVDQQPIDSVKTSKVQVNETDDVDDAAIKAGKSYEQKLSDLMVVVRSALTELLLEVTNEEISNIAQEAIKARKSKASSAQVIRKSALTTITGKLGLAAYDDTSSSDNNASEDECSDEHTDTDEELKLVIRSKRRAFSKLAEDIEERIAAANTREEQKLKYYSQLEEQQMSQQNEAKRNNNTIIDDHRRVAGSFGNTTKHKTEGDRVYAKEFGETTDTKLQHSNGKRSKERPHSTRKERTTRFSDNKDAVSSSASTFFSQSNASNANAIFFNSTSNLYPIASNSKISATASNPSGSSSIVNTMNPYQQSSSNINNILNAADAAFEKAIKKKTKVAANDSEKQQRLERDQRERRRRHNSAEKDTTSSSSPSSTTPTDSDGSNSTTNSSRYSKYSVSPTTKLKRQSERHRHHSKSSSNSSRRQSGHKKSKSRSSTRRERGERKHKRDSNEHERKRDHRRHRRDRDHRRRQSSGSDDHYEKDNYQQHHHEERSSHRTKKRTRSRSHSNSHSRSSYSSTRH